MQQNNRLFGLLAKLGLGGDDRADLCRQFSAGRTSSSRELLAPEADLLIAHLERLAEHGEPGKLYRMRRKVYSLAHELGWERPDGTVDVQRLDAWCMHFGRTKKDFHEHTLAELRDLITQLEIVLRKTDAHG
mgnify:CR=1 FL=1